MTKKKILKGKIVSTSMAKTVVVSVARLTKHPKYKKYFLQHKKYKVHDAEGRGKVGEVVTIESCRPISRDKHFRLVGPREAHEAKS